MTALIPSIAYSSQRNITRKDTTQQLLQLVSVKRQLINNQLLASLLFPVVQ